ncbi:GNAT family N-acetyltransferase [Loigolactobacillus iwatensis]|uniref:GNAT family N-acetyltransferase n=1 Tax=Loigolactobacillus iwatensis TaxID=1267156 RepID=UPI001CDB8922|nr:GNAT family N-acetyltransferase [Loigolactobacillus iwatensis]
MKLHVGSEPWQRAAALYVRMQVFVQERHIALIDEFDQHDTSKTSYAVMYTDNEQPVATGRLQFIDAATIQPGRIATLSEYRGQGLGAQVINALEEVGQHQGYQKSLIHSERTAQGFYEQLGYQPVSGTFIEDGIPCVLVSKTLFTKK